MMATGISSGVFCIGQADYSIMVIEELVFCNKVS